MLLTTQHICSSTGPAQKEALANSSKPVIPVHCCCVESSFCSVRLAQYSSTRVPVSVFIGARGNSERCNMTGNEDNVGFLATGSGVKQFQLSLGRWFVPRCRRFSQELSPTKHTTSFLTAAAVQTKTGASNSQAAVRGTPTSGVPETVPVKAYQCLWKGVSRTRLFHFGGPMARGTVAGSEL